jgi:hypothetical protein
MSFVSPSRNDYDAWICPFCDAVAAESTAASVQSESRTCACGAVGLAGPACDVDALMEDAVLIFGVAAREDTRMRDVTPQADARLPGVEMRHGRTVALKRGLLSRPLDWTSLWFRR